MTKPTIETAHDAELQKARRHFAKEEAQPVAEATTEKKEPVDPLNSGCGFIPGEGI